MDTRTPQPPTDLRTELPTDPSKCRWCGEDLPPRPTGKRGRPRVTHKGACDRAYTTKSDTERRYAAFRAAHRLQADRSSTLGLGEVNYMDEIDGRFEPMPHDPFGEKVPRQLVETWEARRRHMRPILEYERRLAAEQAAARPSLLQGMTDAERDAAVKRAVANRRARMGQS